VANQLENGATSPCGQSTKAILISDRNKYEFIIPRNEMGYTSTIPIHLSFAAFDSFSGEKRRFMNNKKSFVLEL
jgi:hypothetical protein